MNAFQLLKVATKVFVNPDKEVQKEAEQKTKKKVDLLAAEINRQGGHSFTQGRG
jgi:phosphoserine phosphatase